MNQESRQILLRGKRLDLTSKNFDILSLLVENSDWKYALSLELEDSGFDFSILSEFRARLLEKKQESLLLDKMLERFR